MLRKTALAAALLLATLAIYLHRQKTNPPGFYSDEASIAINAMSIARDGTDEFGTPFPLYFRAFGEYKNPVYIYLLAGLFKAAYPSELIARRFSAVAGWAAAIVLGVLAWRITRRPWLTAAAFLLAALTPALFEMSRLVFEVALFPLVVSLFLLALHVAHARERWNAWIVASLVITLALISYTYTAGRMLAPLYAAGLLLFATRERRKAVIATLALFALTSIAPMVIYHYRSEGALLARGRDTSYFIYFQGKPADVVAALERNIVQNLLPIGMAVRGDPNLRHHTIDSGGSILGGTLLLAIAAAVAIIRGTRRDPWWRFVLIGTLVSVLPAALTNDVYHVLRLAAYVVFVIVLSIAALEMPRVRTIALVLAAIQLVWFFRGFERYGPHRRDWFDAGAKTVARAAFAHARGERPIYVQGLTYAHAWWYADLEGIPRQHIVRLEMPADVPPRSLFISAGDCPGCRELAKDGFFKLYETPGTDLP